MVFQSQQESLFLQGEDRLYINANETVSSQGPGGSDDEEAAERIKSVSHVVTPNPHVGNKQWIVIPIPYNYLDSNWPIRVS